MDGIPHNLTAIRREPADNLHGGFRLHIVDASTTNCDSQLRRTSGRRQSGRRRFSRHDPASLGPPRRRCVQRLVRARPLPFDPTGCRVVRSRAAGTERLRFRQGGPARNRRGRSGSSPSADTRRPTISSGSAKPDSTHTSRSPHSRPTSRTCSLRLSRGAAASAERPSLRARASQPATQSSSPVPPPFSCCWCGKPARTGSCG